jgi:hypothetical protein
MCDLRNGTVDFGFQLNGGLRNGKKKLQKT